jgi:hypothetical protein
VSPTSLCQASGLASRAADEAETLDSNPDVCFNEIIDMREPMGVDSAVGDVSGAGGG